MQITNDEPNAQITERLHDDEIHVWQLRYRRENGRNPLRSILGAYLGLSPEAVTLIDGEHGRPGLAPPWDRSISFNWSHSADAAIVAIARGDVVPGIDVERRRPRPHAMQIAERYFCAEETAALAKLDATHRELAFLELWTAKEAVLKALGRGLAFGLDRLRLAVAPAVTGLLWLDQDDATQWHVKPLALDASLVGSVAWRGPARHIHVRTLADPL